MRIVLYRSIFLFGSLAIYVLLIGHCFILGTFSKGVQHGKTVDSGNFPKRTKNVNAWYVPTADSTPLASQAYPIEFQPGPPGSLNTNPNVGKPARIGIAYTTQCPIFRSQDDGSTDPVLIG